MLGVIGDRLLRVLLVVLTGDFEGEAGPNGPSQEHPEQPLSWIMRGFRGRAGQQVGVLRLLTVDGDHGYATSSGDCAVSELRESLVNAVELAEDSRWLI